MHPDDPLGHHGPNLDSFLRKKPIVPDDKKQACIYGKKRTYGTNYKYSYPERENLLQLFVAYELCVMSRSTASKIANEGGLGKSNSVLCSTKNEATSNLKYTTPKRQSEPSISIQDMEKKLPTKNKLETRSDILLK